MIDRDHDAFLLFWCEVNEFLAVAGQAQAGFTSVRQLFLTIPTDPAAAAQVITKMRLEKAEWLAKARDGLTRSFGQAAMFAGLRPDQLPA